MTEMLRPLAPLLITAATIVIAMLAIAIRRNKRLVAGISMIGVSAALVALLPAVLAGDTSATPVTSLLVLDGVSRLGMVMVLVAALGVLVLCIGYFERFAGQREELYLLILTGTLGAQTLVCAQHVASLLLGLELLGVPLVGAIAYFAHQRAVEAGIKYLILSAAASGTLLFGAALIFADTGSLELARFGAAIATAGIDAPLVATGAAMMLAGFAFKLSLVPFHQWTPDVYEGAPVPVTAFLATVGKVGPVIAVLRIFDGTLVSSVVAGGFWVLALASLLVGSVLALRQTNLKRLLAYSSVAHFGYIAAVISLPGVTSQIVAVYLMSYVITSIGVFGVLCLASGEPGVADRERLVDWQGFFWEHPALAVALVGMLLSLAGIPLTVGFVGKLVVISVNVSAAEWLLIGGIVFASLVGAFYYLRVVGLLLQPAAGASSVPALEGRVPAAGSALLLVSAALTIGLGIFPEPLFDWARQFVLR